MDTASCNNNNKNNNNTTTSDVISMIIDNLSRESGFHSIKSIHKDPACDGLCNGIIEAFIIPGVVHEHARVSS